MRRCLLVLTCVFLLAALCPSAVWGAEPPPDPGTTPSNLMGIRNHVKGIQDVLGGVLVFRVLPWAMLGMVGLMLLAAGLSPARVARSERAVRQGGWKVVLVGIVSVLGLVAVAAILGRVGGGGLGVLAVLVLGFLMWLGVHGLAGTAAVVGRRLMHDTEGTHSPWRVVGSGGLAVAATLVVPIFGWALFIYLFCRGVGAATLALFSGDTAAPLAPVAEPSDDSAEAPLLLDGDSETQ